MGNPLKIGMANHHSHKAQTTSWITPKYILEALGDFDLDPCTSDPQPWPTAKEMWTTKGLGKKWFGRVWLNPPYGKETDQWLSRLADHGKGTSLIFARTETKSFFKNVWYKATGILFIKGRLRFARPDGTIGKIGNAGAPSVLISYGKKDAKILENCGIEGKFIPLVPKIPKEDLLR